jgi:alkylation response protein AidB-like acyl-CoA dehydrogenase
MEMVFSPEQHDFRSTIRKFLEAKSPEAEVRRLMETVEGFDPAVWAQLSEQLGLQALTVPEQYGGAGFGYVEMLIVLEEMGRALLCAPYLSTAVLATQTLLLAGDDPACSAHLPTIASGRTIATLAVTEHDGKWAQDSIRTAASRRGQDWALRGEKSFVLDGFVADLVFVAARTDDGGIGIFAVNGDSPGLTRTPMTTMDQTRKQAVLSFDDVAAQLVGGDGQGWSTVSQVLDMAGAALAAEQVGGAQKCLDLCVEYAKTRKQFGRPIGSFQAIKHKCADMFVAIEAARSAAYHACWTAADGGDGLPVAASIAQSYCSEAYNHAAAESLHIHGGIGFTWEHVCHLYFKRAKSSEVLFGTPWQHRELIAQRIGM